MHMGAFTPLRRRRAANQSPEPRNEHTRQNASREQLQITTIALLIVLMSRP